MRAPGVTPAGVPTLRTAFAGPPRGSERYPAHAIVIRSARTFGYLFAAAAALCMLLAIVGLFVTTFAGRSGPKSHGGDLFGGAGRGMSTFAGLAMVVYGLAGALFCAMLSLNEFFFAESLQVVGDIEANTRKTAESIAQLAARPAFVGPAGRAAEPVTDGRGS